MSWILVEEFFRADDADGEEFRHDETRRGRRHRHASAKTSSEEDGIMQECVCYSPLSSRCFSRRFLAIEGNKY